MTRTITLRYAAIAATITLSLLAGLLAGGCGSPTPTAPPIGGALDAQPSGVTTFNNISTGALTASGALTADSATIGGGYGSTGCTISNAGVIQCNGAATTGGALTADSAAIGGGYGSTGCSTSNAGAFDCNGAITSDAALTGLSLAIGGGYGSTGCSISAAGVLQCNGAATFDGAVTAAGVNTTTPISIKEASYTLLTSDTGTLFVVKPDGTITMTLPADAAGLNFCVVNWDGSDVYIDPQSADSIAFLTNASGDRITNTTAGDFICLVAPGGDVAGSWIPLSRLGTWSDGN